jgi:hypothetical protein
VSHVSRLARVARALRRERSVELDTCDTRKRAHEPREPRVESTLAHEARRAKKARETGETSVESTRETRGKRDKKQESQVSNRHEAKRGNERKHVSPREPSVEALVRTRHLSSHTVARRTRSSVGRGASSNRVADPHFPRHVRFQHNKRIRTGQHEIFGTAYATRAARIA